MRLVKPVASPRWLPLLRNSYLRSFGLEPLFSRMASPLHPPTIRANQPGERALSSRRCPPVCPWLPPRHTLSLSSLRSHSFLSPFSLSLLSPPRTHTHTHSLSFSLALAPVPVPVPFQWPDAHPDTTRPLRSRQTPRRRAGRGESGQTPKGQTPKQRQTPNQATAGPLPRAHSHLDSRLDLAKASLGPCRLAGLGPERALPSLLITPLPLPRQPSGRRACFLPPVLLTSCRLANRFREVLR